MATSPKMKFVIDDKIPFIRGILEPFAEVDYQKGAAMTPASIAGADALIVRTRTRCDAKLLTGGSVKFVATATIGYDHIDASDLAGLGIKWCNAPGCNAASVAQYLAAVLTGFGVPLAGRTLGVVGVGNVGKLAVKVGEALGMCVLLNDPPRAEAEGPDGFVSLAEIASEADFVTLHVPKIVTGRHPTVKLLDENFFRAAKTGVCLVNAARGEAVDGAALKAALRSGKVAHSAIDVWENEPDIDLELLQLVDFATPHIAGYSTDGKTNGTTAAVRAVAEFFGISELKTWRAVPPDPANAVGLSVDESADEEREIHRLVCHTFDLHQADRDLREDPAGFERQRGNAPLRREPFAYTVSGGSEKLRRKLAALGFKLK